MTSDPIHETAGLLAHRIVNTTLGRTTVLELRKALEAEGLATAGLTDSDVAAVLALCVVRDAPELYPHAVNPLNVLASMFPGLPAARAWAAYRRIRPAGLIDQRDSERLSAALSEVEV